MNARLSPSGQEIGDTLPDGIYAGQPVAWDEAEQDWLPLSLGSALVYDEWDAAGAQMFQVGDVVNVLAATLLQLTTADYALDIDPSTFVHVNAAAGLAAVAVAVSLQDATSFASLELDSGSAILGGGEGQSLILDTSGARLESPAIGFFDAVPIAKPAVSGATLALQLASLLTKLQALGLITNSVAAPGQLGVLVQSLGYTVAAPLVLQLLPAGHAPGLYFVSYVPIVRTAATAGTLGRSMQYTAPGGSTFGVPNATITLIVAAPLVIPPVVIESSGATALTLTLSGSGVTGSPVVDIYACAVMQAAP